MIKNGNYEWFDFEGNKEKILDILISDYGQQHDKTIRERMDKVRYVPYVSYDYVSTYANARFDDYKDEIVDNFKKLSHRDTLTPEQLEVVWGENGTQLFTANMYGGNLTTNPLLGESRKSVMETREKVCKAFDLSLEDESTVDALAKEARTLKEAIDIMMKNNPCDVFVDLNRVIRSKAWNLQSFLNRINKANLYQFSDKDKEIIKSSEFDAYSAENLDCKHILYGTHIGEPGLVYYFTSECDEKLETQLVEDYIKVLTGRIKYFILHNGMDSLKHITEDEILKKVEIEDKVDYSTRLVYEYQHQVELSPHLHISSEEADSIESTRKFHESTLYDGCKFVKNIQESQNGGGIHNPDGDSNWCTTMEYVDDNIALPINYLYFNENQFYTGKTLTGNMLHECGHAISNGHVLPSKRSEEIYTRYGLTGYRSEIDESGVIIGHVTPPASYEEDGMLLIEENFNERLAKGNLDRYLQKYGLMFEDSEYDIGTDEEMDCQYDYWNFLTERLWEDHRKDYKQFRVTEGANIFYDVDDGVPPLGKAETTKNAIKYIIQKHLTPDKVQSQGTMSFRLTQELSRLILQFRTDVVPTLEEENIGTDELRPENFDNLDVDDSIIEWLKAACKEADKIYDEMDKEEERINEIRRHQEETKVNGQVLMLRLSAHAKQAREKIKSLIDKGANKFGINKKQDRVLVLHRSDDKESPTLGDDE